MDSQSNSLPIIDGHLKHNLGTRAIKPLRTAQFPDAGAAVRQNLQSRPPGAVDVVLVNPPAPDGGIWIRTQHRVGRRSREQMIWPQCSLAQLAAMLSPDYSVCVIDAIAERMSWADFETLLRSKAPKYYLTHVTAPTLTNDMYGVMLAKSIGAATIAFGTHVTPLPVETMRSYPALDYVLRGEPELTLRELIDSIENRQVPEWMVRLLQESDASWLAQEKSFDSPALSNMTAIRGLVWRNRGEIQLNAERPFIRDLNQLPLPMYDLLPLHKYRMPLMKGPFCFVLTSRGCPAGCKYCIKHVSYQYSVRLLSPERVVQEIRVLYEKGIRNIHMYADLFTVNREQVVGICEQIIDEGIKIKWTCNSRVDYVDAEMLQLMGKAGCWMISWGIESGDETLLRMAAKGADPKKAKQALTWARAAGIKNWGYFMIGLPGETVDTIRKTIALSKQLPLEIALFHVAAPYPGTPFFFEVIEKGWFKKGTRWEQVDMDKDTVVEYENLSAEDILYWQRRAFREWVFRWGPAWTFAKMLLGDYRMFKRTLEIGMEHFKWVFKSRRPKTRGENAVSNTAFQSS